MRHGADPGLALAGALGVSAEDVRVRETEWRTRDRHPIFALLQSELSMGVPISFPFERDKSYPIGDLRRFQAVLSQARQQDRGSVTN